MENSFYGFIFLILYSGYSITVNAQGCDPMCKVCENEQCLECEPYFYKQVILQPERESPVPFNPGNETSSTTVSTSTTVATTPTPTTTTTTEPGVTTEIPTFVKCVSQCDPGWYGDLENKSCEKCSVEKCAMCSENGTVCLVCVNGWDLQGNKCKKLSPTEIALIALTSIFGFVLLVVVIIAIVYAARKGYFKRCSSCPCGPCTRPVTSRRHSISAPGKDDLGIHAVKKVDRTSTASKRYTREPTQKRKQSLTMAEKSEYKSDPVYPGSYTTPINTVEPEGQEEYEGYDDTAHQPAAVTEEYYDDVGSPENKDGINARTTNETGKKKRFPFIKKKSKENEKDKTPPKMPTQQEAVSKMAMVFRKEPPKPKDSRFKKARQPSPVPRIKDNEVDEEYYNDVASPSEYSDTEMPGGEPPLYENVEEMRQGISGTNSSSQKGREGQQPVYGNVDPAISYANVEEGVQRPIRGRRIANKRDSKC